MSHIRLLVFGIVGIIVLAGCHNDNHDEIPLFNLLDSDVTGVTFSNNITETKLINYFTYPYLYMGGGVAIGDIDNDGLQDIYFTSNMNDNKLYRNVTTSGGGLKFEDITATAGVAGDDRWDTGVAMVDINADGWLDICVSVSGKWTSKKNILYINQGDRTFLERAEEVGLADEGHTTQTAFLDFDRDGDLDAYVLNYPPLHFKSPNFVYSQNALNPKIQTSDKLYRNDEGRFVDITEQAGVLNFGLGLGVSVADFNNDGWQDIYVSNDFAASDFFYINNQDGTFSNRIKESFPHTAYYGMGTDVADVDNNGLLDLMQVDMTPEDNFRSKANMASMNPDNFWEMISLDIDYQYMENAFQYNYGISADGIPLYGDMSRLTGTALTDWSWSPLFADFDNDGNVDLHITNGTRRDINNKDFFKKIEKETKLSDLEKSQKIPAMKIANYAFRNKGELAYDNVGEKWGLDYKGYSNGSAYGDLDNDGDLDLVVNNIDDVASIYENQSHENNWLRVRLISSLNKNLGIGARVTCYVNDKILMSESHRVRGYQSSSESIVHFGLGNVDRVDSLLVRWGNGHYQMIKNIRANQLLSIEYKESNLSFYSSHGLVENNRFSEIKLEVPFVHEENDHDDFEKEVLLPHAMSKFGPALAVGDVNNDGLEDFYIGAARGKSGRIYLQTKTGGFRISEENNFLEDAQHEDMDALFFDADNDSWQDLYIVSGGNEELPNAEYYRDRFYKNNNGRLIKSLTAIPEVMSSGSKVKGSDIDGDGDIDLLVSSRLMPQNYGKSSKSYLLLNESNADQITFKDVTNKNAPDFADLGMVTDFAWSDYDKDGDDDLVIIGEWMPVSFYNNDEGHFRLDRGVQKAKDSYGWWFSIAADDLNGDGRDDYVLGNLGQNYKYQTTDTEPFELYIDDFDSNSQNDIVLGYRQNGESYPVRGRQCSAEQIDNINDKYKTYNAFAAATLSEIYTESALSQSEIHVKANTFASQIWYSNADGGYDTIKLPAQCQFSSTNAIVIHDVDRDGDKDLLLGGNLFSSEVETKRNDASIGQYLANNGSGKFSYMPYGKSGLCLRYDLKNLEIIDNKSHSFLLAANNNGPLQILKF